MALVETTKDQAQANWQRNRGEPGQWFEHKADYREPQSHPRIRPEAEQCAQRNRPTMADVLCQQRHWQQQQQQQQAPVRLRDEEAVRIADKMRHQEDKWFDFQGNQAFRPKPRPVRVYPPANAELLEKVNQAAENDWFDHSARQQQQQQLAAGGRRCTTEAGRQIADSMRRSGADWFQHDPRPASAPAVRCPTRTTGEGAEFAERNRRGTGAEWATRQQAEEAVVVYGSRCPTASAQANCEAARGQQMRDCFAARPPSQPQPRPQSQAPPARGLVFGDENRSQPPPPARRTRPEASDFAAKAGGSLGQWLDQEANRSYSSPRPQPRVRPGPAQEAAERNKGAMGSCLSDTDYKPGPRQRKTHERANKSEAAKELAARGRGDAAKQLLASSNLPPEPARKSKAVTAWAEESAAMNRGTAGLVITGVAPPSARAPGQRVRPEAAHVAEKYRGGGFFKTIQMRPPTGR